MVYELEPIQKKSILIKDATKMLRWMCYDFSVNGCRKGGLFVYDMKWSWRWWGKTSPPSPSEKEITRLIYSRPLIKVNGVKKQSKVVLWG